MIKCFMGNTSHTKKTDLISFNQLSTVLNTNIQNILN